MAENAARLLRNVAIKALLLFLALNVIYYATQPMRLLNRITVYNTLAPGRLRPPFSEHPDVSYNMIMPDIDQMLASHVLAHPKASDEFRVVLLGDSSVWGYLLEPTQTQAECLNRLALRTASGKQVRVYNLGYPTLTVMKDMLILRHVLRYQPDLLVWPTTLASLYPSDQLDFEIVHAQYDEVAQLQAQYKFNLYQWPLRPPTWFDRTLIGQRRALADWLRYQLYALGWAATLIDHHVPKFVTPHPDQLSPDDNILSVNVMHLTQPGKLTAQDLSFDILKAGIQIAQESDVPVVLINEPIYRGNSDVRWNFYYPKWAYDSYREALHTTASSEGWQYLDLWDVVAPDQFLDTDFHLTAVASCDYAKKLAEPILKAAGSR